MPAEIGRGHDHRYSGSSGGPRPGRQPVLLRRLAAFLQSYDKSWGIFKPITHPAVGNHEYLTAGGSSPSTGCDSTNAGAAGYYQYFGAAAGDPTQGYYSYDVGTWHLIALNSNCGNVGGCTPTSPQGQWLAADLAANTTSCTLAYWHIPLFSSGGRAARNTATIWTQLTAAKVDVVLNGHDHIYERFAPQTADGAASADGIREFIVGTGGANHTSIATVAANSVVRDATTFGVLKMTLHAGSYNWQFVPSRGTFTDSGSAACHKGGTSRLIRPLLLHPSFCSGWHGPRSPPSACVTAPPPPSGRLGGSPGPRPRQVHRGVIPTSRSGSVERAAGDPPSARGPTRTAW